MAFHSEPRFTKDIDILLDQNNFNNARETLLQEGFIESAEPWTFDKTDLTLHRFFKRIKQDELVIDLLVAGTEGLKRVIERAVCAESEDGVICVARKEDLILLKQIRNSKQDQADIERLENEQD
jgi:hypothetical protein